METKNAETISISDEKDRKYFKSYNGGVFPFTSNMIEEVYVSLETAKLAKEKGFDEEFENMHVWNNFKGEILEDVSGYNMKNSHLCKNSYSAPTQSLLARWLREKYNFTVVIVPTIGYCRSVGITKYNFRLFKKWNLKYVSSKSEDTYEEAMEEGLKEALKIL